MFKSVVELAAIMPAWPMQFYCGLRDAWWAKTFQQKWKSMSKTIAPAIDRCWWRSLLRKQRRDLLAIPAVIFVLRSAGVLSLVVMSVLVRNFVIVAICNHQLPIHMPGGGGEVGLPPYSLGGGVPLGLRTSCHLLDQILQILWPYTRLKMLSSWFQSFVSDPFKQDPILDQFFSMITRPYTRPNALENHTLSSGTCTYSQYMGVTPPPPPSTTTTTTTGQRKQQKHKWCIWMSG